MIGHEIRPLGALPWPPGLGKLIEYPRLQARLTRLLGERSADSAVHEDMVRRRDPAYREVVLTELSAAPWASDLIESVDMATDLARRSPLLNKRFDDASARWVAWAKQSRETVAPSVRSWLESPARVTRESIENGRHIPAPAPPT